MIYITHWAYIATPTSLLRSFCFEPIISNQGDSDYAQICNRENPYNWANKINILNMEEAKLKKVFLLKRLFQNSHFKEKIYLIFSRFPFCFD